MDLAFGLKIQVDPNLKFGFLNLRIGVFNFLGDSQDLVEKLCHINTIAFLLTLDSDRSALGGYSLDLDNFTLAKKIARCHSIFGLQHNSHASCASYQGL